MPTINEVTTLEVKDNVAVLTLNSPPVNALSANVREGLNGKDFTLFQKVMESEKFWCKTTCAERLSFEGPETNYSDILPFMNLLINNFSDRVLWGTDWPHPNMRSHMPDDGILVDLLEIIAPKSEHQKKILVDNPNKLYWGN